jgi:hypothetical protein
LSAYSLPDRLPFVPENKKLRLERIHVYCRYQLVRMTCARPSASPSSVLLICVARAAFRMTCIDTHNRNSKRFEVVELPHAQRPGLNPHSFGLRSPFTNRGTSASGVVRPLPAQIFRPASSTTHTLVTICDTSQSDMLSRGCSPSSGIAAIAGTAKVMPRKNSRAPLPYVGRCPEQMSTATAELRVGMLPSISKSK